jgi:hypothetical protein
MHQIQIISKYKEHLQLLCSIVELDVSAFVNLNLREEIVDDC